MERPQKWDLSIDPRRPGIYDTFWLFLAASDQHHMLLYTNRPGFALEFEN